MNHQESPHKTEQAKTSVSTYQAEAVPMTMDSPPKREKRFLLKIASLAQRIGREILEKSLQLFYAAQHPTTPAWAKRVVYGALAYLIFPLDALPDFLPALGFTDDLSVIGAALATIATYINDEVRHKARTTACQWLGQTPEKENGDSR